MRFLVGIMGTVQTVIGLAFAGLIIYGIVCLIFDPAGTMYFIGNLIGTFLKAIVVAVKGAL